MRLQQYQLEAMVSTICRDHSELWSDEVCDDIGSHLARHFFQVEGRSALSIHGDGWSPKMTEKIWLNQLGIVLEKTFKQEDASQAELAQKNMVGGMILHVLSQTKTAANRYANRFIRHDEL